MAKLGNYRRIYKQDYSETFQPDVEVLSSTLNESFDAIYNALTNQITFADNINCTVVSFDVTVGNDFAPIAPVTLKMNSYQSASIGIIPIKVVAKNNSTTLPNGGLYLDYSINNNTTSSSNATNTGNKQNNPFTISVNYIKGLPAGSAFTVTVIIV